MRAIQQIRRHHFAFSTRLYCTFNSYATDCTSNFWYVENLAAPPLLVLLEGLLALPTLKFRLCPYTSPINRRYAWIWNHNVSTYPFGYFVTQKKRKRKCKENKVVGDGIGVWKAKKVSLFFCSNILSSTDFVNIHITNMGNCIFGGESIFKLLLAYVWVSHKVFCMITMDFYEIHPVPSGSFPIVILFYIFNHKTPLGSLIIPYGPECLYSSF